MAGQSVQSDKNVLYITVHYANPYRYVLLAFQEPPVSSFIVHHHGLILTNILPIDHDLIHPCNLLVRTLHRLSEQSLVLSGNDVAVVHRQSRDTHLGQCVDDDVGNTTIDVHEPVTDPGTQLVSDDGMALSYRLEQSIQKAVRQSDLACHATKAAADGLEAGGTVFRVQHDQQEDLDDVGADQLACVVIQNLDGLVRSAV